MSGKAFHRDNSRQKARDVRRTQYASNVAEAVGEITHGCEIYGLSRGQYSLIDLIEHVLAHTGKADLVVSTWTAAGADIEYALRLCEDDRVGSISWLVDSSFPVRQPAYCAAMRSRFGDEAIRIAKTHAKFVLVGNEAWSVVIRTSMNLNENRRLESWEISDDPDLYGYLAEIVAEVFSTEGIDLGGAKPDSEAYTAFVEQTRAHMAPKSSTRYV